MLRKAMLPALIMLLVSGQAYAKQTLQQAASDPTAALMSVLVQDWYTGNYHNLDGESANQIVLRSAMPFKIGDQQNIFRVTIPVVTDSPFLDSGLSDTTVFNLSTFNQSWGRWGVGAVGLLPTGGEKRGLEKWGLGPAFGFVAGNNKRLFGLFNQNIFTVAGDDDRDDVNVSTLQPIVNIALGHGWSIGASEMSITYNWEQNKFTSLPLGLSVSKLHRFGKLPVQFSGQYEYDFADDAISDPEYLIRFSVKFILPSIL